MRRVPIFSCGLWWAVCIFILLSSEFSAGRQVPRGTSAMRQAEVAALQWAHRGKQAEVLRIMATWIHSPDTAHRAGRLIAELETISGNKLRVGLDPVETAIIDLHRKLLTAEPNSPEVLLDLIQTAPNCFYWDYELVRQLKPLITERVRLFLRHLGPTDNPFVQLAGDCLKGARAVARLPLSGRLASNRALDALAVRAEILLQYEQLDAARLTAGRVVEMASGADDCWRAAEGRILLAQIAISVGDEGAAERHLDQASRLTADFPLPSLCRRRDCVTAMLRVRQGRLTEAADLFKSALASGRDLHDRVHAAAMVNRGFVLDELGQSTEAVRCYESALAYYEARDDSTAVALVRLNRGALLERLNLIERAKEDYESVLTLSPSDAASSLIVLAEGNLGNIYSRKRRWDEAVNCYLRAIAAAEGTGEWARAAQIAGNLAITQLANKHEAAAKSALRKARRLHNRQPTPLGQFMIRGVSAHFLFEQGKMAQAVKEFGSLGDELRSAGYRALAWEMYFFQGKALAGLGRHEQALECFNRTMDDFERLEQDCANAEIQLHFLENCDEVVEASLASLVELMRRGSPSAWTEAEAFRLIEAYRGRVLVREMGGQLPTNSSSAVMMKLSAVQSWLKRRSAFAVMIFQGVEAVYRLQLSGHDARLEKVTSTDRFKETVAAAGWDRPEAELARQSLAQILLGNAMAQKLRQCNELFVLPDGCLYHLPVELLPVTASDGRTLPLGEQLPVIYLPAWRFLAVRDSIDADRTSVTGFLGIHGFPSGAAGKTGLPWAEQEVRVAARTLRWPQIRLVAGEEFSRGIGPVNQPGHTWDVIHVATHIETDEAAPWESRILLTTQGNQTISVSLSELQASRWQANLVVLSGCSSGRGRVFPGDGNFSLGRAMLASGSRAVLLTLSPVLDMSAAAFMDRFYRELPRHSGQAAFALRAARRWMRRDPAFHHPRHWGSFVLFGLPHPIKAKAADQAREDLIYLLVLLTVACTLAARIAWSSTGR